MEKTISQDNWKGKAKARRLENKFLKQRGKELVFSRDIWKTKALARGARVKELETELDQFLKVQKKTIARKRE